MTDTVTSLMRPVRQHAADEEMPAVPPVVLLGTQGEPAGLLLHDARTGEAYTAPVSLRVHPSTGITDVLQRALTGSRRTASTRSSAPTRTATWSACCASRTSRPPPRGPADP